MATKTGELDQQSLPIPQMRRESANLKSPIDGKPSSLLKGDSNGSYQEDKMPNEIDSSKYMSHRMTKEPRSPLGIIRGRSFERRTSRLRELQLAYSDPPDPIISSSRDTSMEVNLSSSRSPSCPSDGSRSYSSVLRQESTMNEGLVLQSIEEGTLNDSQRLILYQQEVQGKLATLKDIVRQHDEEISQEQNRHEERPELDDLIVIKKRMLNHSNPTGSPSAAPVLSQDVLERLTSKLRKDIARQELFFKTQRARQEEVHESLEDRIRELERDNKEMRHRNSSHR
ncbi:MAG: hypothetical protein MMC33_001506 [Icmadophila ericetorum]|nr:hypothetical protein [Icmadophila ericetorum]